MAAVKPASHPRRRRVIGAALLALVVCIVVVAVDVAGARDLGRAELSYLTHPREAVVTEPFCPYPLSVHALGAQWAGGTVNIDAPGDPGPSVRIHRLDLDHATLQIAPRTFDLTRAGDGDVLCYGHSAIK